MGTSRVGRYKDAKTNETSLNYYVYDYCNYTFIGEGGGIIPDSAYTGNINRAVSLSVDVSTVPNFAYSGTPLNAQVTWTKSGTYGYSFNGTNEYWSVNNGVKYINRTRGHSEELGANISGSLNLFDASNASGYVSDSLNIVHENEKN